MKTTCEIGLCREFAGPPRSGVTFANGELAQLAANAAATRTRASLIVTDHAGRRSLGRRVAFELHPILRRLAAGDGLELPRRLSVVERVRIVRRIVRPRIGLRELRQSEVIF